MMIHLLLAVATAWLALGILHYILCMKDWHSEPRKRPHVWVYALAVAPMMIAFGPIGLIIRDYIHIHFPHWFTHDPERTP